MYGWETEVVFDYAVDPFFQGWLKAIGGEDLSPNPNGDWLCFQEAEHSF